MGHGDKLILGVLPQELNPKSDSPRAEELAQFVQEGKEQGWTEKFKIASLDARCEHPAAALERNLKSRG